MKINSIGTAVPSFKLSQLEIATMCSSAAGANEKRSEALLTLYKKAEVQTRYTVLSENDRKKILASTLTGTAQRMRWYQEYSPELAKRAALDAFGRTPIEPKNITHLITVSCTGFTAPGLDCELVALLGLSPQVSRTHIGFQGCHGTFNALRVAKAFVAEDPAAVVLVVSVELCTLHLAVDKDLHNAVANSLFGDGAAAAICSADGDAAIALQSSGSALIAQTKDLMSWNIGDAGFSMMLSSKLPDLITSSLGALIDPWLETYGHSVESMGGFAIHPGGPRILTACQEALGLEEHSLQSSRKILRSYGNMSSATILFVIAELLRAETALPYLGVGFGPGITAEYLLMT